MKQYLGVLATLLLTSAPVWSGGMPCYMTSWQTWSACEAYAYDPWPCRETCYQFADTNGVGGYYVTTRDLGGGEATFYGPVIDVSLLPADFVNGDILSGAQLNAAMGAADYCGTCGDVPPAPEDPPGTYGDGPGTEETGPPM